MMKEYNSGSNSLANLDSPDLFPANATCHSKNTERWNDFHEHTQTRDTGRREFTHKELGDRMHNKLVEERHLEGPSGKADQWHKKEYFESSRGGTHARVLRNEHALKEHMQHVTNNEDGTTRKTSSRSSTVHVSTHMTTKKALGEGGMDLLSLEDHSPLDHSPQKGKGSLGKQGALNQRRKPSKGSWRSNPFQEADANGDAYIDDIANSRSNPRPLNDKVQKRNAENYWRSKTTTTTNDESKYQNYSKKIVNDVTATKSTRNWERHKRDNKPGAPEELKADNPRTPIVGSIFCGTRSPPDEPDSVRSHIRSTDKELNSNVIVLNTGTWTRKDKSPPAPERLVRDSTTAEVTSDATWSSSRYRRDVQPSPASSPDRGRKFALHGERDYKYTKGTAVTSTRKAHSDTTYSHTSAQNKSKQTLKDFNLDRKSPQSHAADTRSKQVSPGVTIVEGPNTKVVSSFRIHDNDGSWKKTSSTTTSQRYGTYVKKERTSSERSPPTEVTINGSHPPTQSPTSSSKNRSSPGPTQRLMLGARTNESNRKLATGHVTKSDDRRSVIMNEIRSFDPKKLRKQHQEKTTLPEIPWKDISLRETKQHQQPLGNSRIASQESVSSWEWVDTHDIATKTHETEKPDWVEVAHQRQHKYEKQEIDESLRRSTPSPTIPTWKTQIRLRATPGVPTKDDIQIKTDYSPRRHVKSPPAESFRSSMVRPEWLQNVKLKKTAHLTEVKGPNVGRVLNSKPSETPKKTETVKTPDIVRPRSPERLFSTSAERFNVSRRAVDDITVDHVLSSIRLIREASASSPNLRDPKLTGRDSPTSLHRRIERDITSPIAKYQTFPRPASPSYGRRSPDQVEVSSAASFATPPQWLVDLKSRVKHTRMHELKSSREGKSAVITTSTRDRSPSPSTRTHTKRRSWSPRTNFSSVLEEIRKVNRSDILTDTRASGKYGSYKHTTLASERPASPSTTTSTEPTTSPYRSHKHTPLATERSSSPRTLTRSESPVSLSPRSQSPRSRSSSPTEKAKLSEPEPAPKTWWVQVPGEIHASDSESRLKRFEAFLHKRATSPPRSPIRTHTSRFSSVTQKSSAVFGRRTPSPPSRRSPSPQDRSESPTCSRYLHHLDRAQSGSDSNITTTTTTTPTKTTKIAVAPKSQSPSRGMITKKTSPKPKSPTPTKSPISRSARPLASSDQKPKTSPAGKQRTTTLTIGTKSTSVQSKATAAREKTTISTPQKSPSQVSKRTPTTSPLKKTEIKERPTRQVTPTRSTTATEIISSSRITKTSSSTADKAATKGRFSQLLTDLSSPPGTLTRSDSLRMRSTTQQPSKEQSTYSTYPNKTTSSSTTKQGSFTSASLVRQVNPLSSTNTYNVRKPRVRFSATEIVWPLDKDGHTPAVTTAHHPIKVNE